MQKRPGTNTGFPVRAVLTLALVADPVLLHGKLECPGQWMSKTGVHVPRQSQGNSTICSSALSCPRSAVSPGNAVPGGHCRRVSQPLNSARTCVLLYF